jgi:hypothetical protein
MKSQNSYYDEIINGVLEENTDDVPGSFEHSTKKLSYILNQTEASGFNNPEAIIQAIAGLIEVASDTMKFAQTQETEREKIRCQRDVAIHQINQTTQLIQKYLDNTFDERKDIFNKQFQVVDEALRTNNLQMLSSGLQHINDLAVQSPFKALSDIKNVQDALNNPDTIWDI